MSTNRLACLADLPELAPGEPEPRTEITLMKLGKYRHPKFGRWNITPETFESFLANFAAQGRVPIDFDHAPERGGPTEAAGWITALRVIGDELRAVVEWTALGAEAIREKRYLFISPTWAWDARNARDQKVGPKLIGAGMTNRPFFSELPALDLSRRAQAAVAFASVDGPLQPEYGRCPCPCCRGDDEVVSADDLDRFATHWAIASQQGIKPAYAHLYEHFFWTQRHLHDDPDGLGDAKIVEAGLSMQRRIWDAFREREPAEVFADDPEPVAFAAPDGLDDDGLRLHDELCAFAGEHEIGDYADALAAMTDRTTRLPLRQMELPADISADEGAAVRTLERRARALAAREQIEVVDAGAILELDERIAELAADTGYSPTPWLDTSRAVVARPWVDADFERDSRRAATLGWELGRDEWAAGAETGRDVVYDEAAERRAARVARVRDQRDQELAAAQEREMRRRKQAIDGELERRARGRLDGRAG
jgi:hypothetical protein